jgi:hypothetical protein
MHLCINTLLPRKNFSPVSTIALSIIYSTIVAPILLGSLTRKTGRVHTASMCYLRQIVNSIA